MSNKSRRGNDYFLVEKTYRVKGKVNRDTILYFGRIDGITPQEIREHEEAIREKCGDEAEKIVKQFRGEVIKANPEMDLFTSRDIQVKEALNYGEVAAFHSLANKLDMVSILNEHADPKGGGLDVGRSMLIQAINKCVEPESIRQTVYWYQRTALPMLMEVPTTKATYDTLRNSLKYWSPAQFKRVERDLWEQVQEKYDVRTDKAYYDPTLVALEGHQSKLSDYTYSTTYPKNKEKILIGVAISPDGFPLFHKVYPGKTDHWKTLDDVHSALEDMGSPEVISVVDRKCSTIDEREDWREDKKKYIASVPRTGEARKTLLDVHTQNCLRKVDLPKEWKDSDPLWLTKVEPPSDLKKKEWCRWIVGFNPELFLDKMKRYKEKRDEVYSELEKVKEKAEKDKYTKKELIEKIDDVLEENKAKSLIDYDVTSRGRPRLQSFSESKTAEEKKRLFGIFLLEAGCVGDDLSPKDIVLAYRERNRVEQAFRTLKSVLGLEPMYGWEDFYVRGRAFVGVLALYLYAALRQELKNADVEMSITEALNALKDIRLATVQVEKDTVVKTTELSDGQEELLHVLDVEAI